MPVRTRLAYASLCLAFFMICATPLFRELTRRTDIWWTPRTMPVPLEDGADRVEIQVRGQAITPLLRAGRLQLADEGSSLTLGTGDIGLRFNNSDRVRAERLALLLVCAAACGVTACMLLLVLTGRLAHRGERGGAGEA